MDKQTFVQEDLLDNEDGESRANEPRIWGIAKLFGRAVVTLDISDHSIIDPVVHGAHSMPMLKYLTNTKWHVIGMQALIIASEIDDLVGEKLWTQS